MRDINNKEFNAVKYTMAALTKSLDPISKE